MRKLLVLVVAILGIGATQAQELSINGNYIQGIEHIGDDIKYGGGFSINSNFDLFKKSSFNFGPSFTYYHLGEIKSDMEKLEGEDELGAGLMAGFDINNIALAVQYEVPFSPNNKGENLFFESVLSGRLKFLPEDKIGLGYQIGVDYFFNKHIFHYTYQVGGGIIYRF